MAGSPIKRARREAQTPVGSGVDIRQRKNPTEALADTRGRKDLPDNLLDLSPVLKETELEELQREMINATPEQFQVMLGKVYRIMLVRGLKDIPAPKSIKEIQALNDMIRRSEGVEARERGGGAPAGGFLPRVVSRRKLEEKVMEAEVVPTAPVAETPGSGGGQTDEGSGLSEVTPTSPVVDEPTPLEVAPKEENGFF